MHRPAHKQNYLNLNKYIPHIEFLQDSFLCYYVKMEAVDCQVK